MRKRLVIGILAHVDAGKTTLSEGLLYLSGKIRKLGRVDHRDTYLDTNPMERERGITIFSKQARFSTDGMDVVLLDTPGHTDFSAEAERTLQVLDYAILVISGTDGVQNHTLTLWQLLRTYRVPTFLFINKTDLPNDGEAALAEQLQKKLDTACFPFFTGEDRAARDERLAMADETLLDAYLSDGAVPDDAIAGLVASRRLFPCFFGSALRLTGVTEFLAALETLTLSPDYPAGFGARVYKIAYDSGSRLTYMKITGGSLRVREEILPGEKAAQIRLYSGDKFTQADEVSAGDVCAVIGLSATYAGQGLGCEADAERPLLEPVLTYRLLLPDDCDVRLFYPKLKQLEEEDPALHLVWQEELREIHAQLMGDVQIDVLKRLIHERFGIDIEVDAGQILYKETIAEAVEGVGHFEPLRHYAEVHLAIEPLPEGSGIILDSRCSENSLDGSWQRLILGSLGEKVHRGVLTGAPLTDVKLTLLAGRASLKHTDGGDFREAAWRAVRQGLMSTKSILLEPYYRYRLEVPTACTGRAISDLQTRFADFTLSNSDDGETAFLAGRAPVSEMRDYMREVIAYTRGAGRLFCTFDGYSPCHNQDEIVAAAGYMPERDVENTPHSVFCAHGAGFVVPWDKVRDYMHIDSGYGKPSADSENELLPSPKAIAHTYHLDDNELEAIMLREFGPMRRRQYKEPVRVEANRKDKPMKHRRRMLLVDGYNVIFQWDSLKRIAEGNLEHARDQLMDMLSNYVAFTKTEVTLVFDAYGQEDSLAREIQRDGYKVVYTAKNETADAYIERVMHELGPDHDIRVVTSDRLIQLSAVHAGISRMSAREFEIEVTRISAEITDFILKWNEKK
ncbi:MAG: TetM/TetW/TetO/TetS family tetracycline resistance ribosomal protection protein [Clostridia bacterium]|nr:TetM/TetW/TetO/TetS family tetracycline resistance ribosomal protection protein [Clostridia bacterium]